MGLFEKEKHVQGIGLTWAYRALAALLRARTSALAPLVAGEGSIATSPSSLPAGEGKGPGDGVRAARRALELADETARTRYPHERDYVRAHWLLGAALRADGPSKGPSARSGGDGLDEADRHLTEALARCRTINLVEFEADILLDLARVRWGQALTPGPSPVRGRGESLREEAMRLAEEALTITERSGYVLQGADVHLFLAEIEIERGDREQALMHARAARRLATCDGLPDHTYKVAYDEAGVLLAKLGEGRREI